MEKDRLPNEQPALHSQTNQEMSSSLFGIPFPAKWRGVLILLILLITTWLTWYFGHNKTIESIIPLPTNSVSVHPIPAARDMPVSVDQ